MTPQDGRPRPRPTPPEDRDPHDAGAQRPPGDPYRHADLLPWYDRCDWQSDPALAYLHGLQDGVELGRQQAEREFTDALAAALGGPDHPGMREAVRRHSRALRARRARAEADRPGPHPGDHPGSRVDRPPASALPHRPPDRTAVPHRSAAG